MRLTRSYEVPVGDVSYAMLFVNFGVRWKWWVHPFRYRGEDTGSTNAAGNASTDEQSLVESEIGYFTIIDAVASEASVER